MWVDNSGGCMTMVEQKYWEPGERSSYGGEYTNIDG